MGGIGAQANGLPHFVARNHRHRHIIRHQRPTEQGAYAEFLAVKPAAIVKKPWKDVAGYLAGVHGMSPSRPGAAKRRAHGKIVLGVV